MLISPIGCRCLRQPLLFCHLGGADPTVWNFSGGRHVAQVLQELPDGRVVQHHGRFHALTG